MNRNYYRNSTTKAIGKYTYDHLRILSACEKGIKEIQVDIDKEANSSFRSYFREKQRDIFDLRYQTELLLLLLSSILERRTSLTVVSRKLFKSEMRLHTYFDTVGDNFTKDELAKIYLFIIGR